MAYNKKEVLEGNIDAIRIILRLEKERRAATEEEQNILRKYQGFGGLKCVLNRTDTADDIRYWNKSEEHLFAPTRQLKQMIYRDAIDATTSKRYWDSIKASVLTSFYTDTKIVGAIADALKTANVEIRTCLDPSSGMGAFTETFSKQVGSVDAMEKDLLTARITMALHPYGKDNIFIRQAPFESIGSLEDKDKYDLITSNIPFGNFMVYDRAYSKGKDVIKQESTRTIHNYFFVKGLDSIKEGGILAFITSQGVLDSPKNEFIRRYLMQNSKLISALRLPSGLFSENAGTEVGSDLIVLQKQTGKAIEKGQEEQFVRTVAVPSGDGFNIAFTHNALFEGKWEEIAKRTVATERLMGADAYGKPTFVYQTDESMEEIADRLRTQLSHDIEQHFDRKLYQTGIAMTEEEKKTLEEDKVKTTVSIHQEERKEIQSNKENSNAYALMPQSIQKQLPKLYSTEDQLIGDRIAYARYFHPMSSYTAYLFEYDPKERLGFGAVTMGHGWELGYMSLDEMQEVKVMGFGIERDLYFTPKPLHQIVELEEIVQGRYTKEKVMKAKEEIEENTVSSDTEYVEQSSLEEDNEPTTNEVVEENAILDETDQAPDGVSSLTLFHQYEKEDSKLNINVEDPRVMNGQTIYFDDEHHPIMDTLNDYTTLEQTLFTPEEYSLWTDEVHRVNKEIKAQNITTQQAKQKPTQQTSLLTTSKRTNARTKPTIQSHQPSLFDLFDVEEEKTAPTVKEIKHEFDASPRPYLSVPDTHLRDGSIVMQNGQIGFLSNLKRSPTFHPMDLSYERITKLKSYIEIRESYHRLYDYEANNKVEDKEEREKLNRLYDNFTARWGYLNHKSNTDLIKMDATGIEMLYLERSDKGKYVKADIFDHPTTFSQNEITLATDPLEALGASLNKYGTVDTAYMSSLLPDMEEEDIISALEGRIYFNPETNSFEVADKFISGNVIEKAEHIDAWLLDHPDNEMAKQSLSALQAAIPTPIPFTDLDFNLGERWIPSNVYSKFATDFFETDISISYHSNMDEYMVRCDMKNANIWHKYAVQGEFRRYDGLHLLKHALHNTIPDINKSKEVTDKLTGETKTIKVRDGEKIQQANAKIEEIRQGFVEWLGRTPNEFKEKLSDRYNRLFNCFVRPNFDGGHQTFPDLDLKRLGIPDLYKSQKDAVWMLKTNGGGICDHEVVRP